MCCWHQPLKMASLFTNKNWHFNYRFTVKLNFYNTLSMVRVKTYKTRNSNFFSPISMFFKYQIIFLFWNTQEVKFLLFKLKTDVMYILLLCSKTSAHVAKCHLLYHRILQPFKLFIPSNLKTTVVLFQKIMNMAYLIGSIIICKQVLIIQYFCSW